MAFKAFDPNGDNSDANSFVSVAYLKTYADDRGKNLPDDDRAIQRLLIQAMDYITARAGKFGGNVTDEEQPLCFPRANLFINGSTLSLDDATIPDGILKAQCELACIIASGVPLYPVTSGAVIKREKVDVLETEYFEPGDNDGMPIMPSVEDFLLPFYSGGGFRVRTVRI